MPGTVQRKRDLFFMMMDKWDKLYNYLNDFRLAIAPDETTPYDERNDRQIIADVLDDVMEEMNKLDKQG